jgi:NMD protein affecting ribosome stability and mRNA decay
MQSSRRDKLILDSDHDPTRPTAHLSDPTVCPDCGATYIEGRWTWRHGPVEAQRRRCSACERIRDDYPAGFVSVCGGFVRANLDELVRIARNTETREKRAHPINRIMRIEESGDGLRILTTETHLAQSIGRALHAAYKGELDFDFQEDIVRVTWRRED